MEDTRRYFKVVAKCGHVGRRKYIPITFAVYAHDGKEAALKTRFIPRVKHDDKQAILSCDEITYEQFQEINAINSEDPYLRCTNSSDQWKIVNFESRLEVETKYLTIKKDKSNSKLKSYYSKRNKEIIKQVKGDYYDYEYQY